MSEYREFTGKSVEEALRSAREAFGAELNDLDFEILTPGSRGVLGMGAEPARIVAAPRAALGGAAPKREAAAAIPLPSPPPPPRDDRPREDRPPRRDDRDRATIAPGTTDRRDDRPRDDRPRDDRPPRRDDRPPRSDDRPSSDRPREDRPPRREDRPPRRDDRPRAGTTALRPRPAAAPPTCRRPRPPRSRPRAVRWPPNEPTSRPPRRRPRPSPPGKAILEQLMGHLGFDVRVEVETGETSRLNVVADGDEKEALGALIGRKGERLSALQHLVNLMLSKEMGAWTRVLVDVEDYRGRRERQLRELADRAAARVVETGKMLQLEPMSALERRWIHLSLATIPASRRSRSARSRTGASSSSRVWRRLSRLRLGVRHVEFGAAVTGPPPEGRETTPVRMSPRS